MNSTELDDAFERGLMLTQHVSGVILIAFNSLIAVLIFLDGDLRNRNYRKYLCSIQVSSLAFDTFSDMYAPLFLTHRELIYSDSLLSNTIGVWSFIAIEFALLGEVVLSYFACVYYRRGIIMGQNGRFNLIGWKRVALFLSLHVYALIGYIGLIYFTKKSAQAAEELLPSELNWVKNKASFMFILPDENWRNALIVIVPISDSISLVVILMLVQLVREVKKVNNWSSTATKSYQRLAVRSLVLQGTVPTFIYFIPLYTNWCLQLAPGIVDVGEGFYRFANILSPIVWIILTKHTLASSLVILYCSPSYRKKIVSVAIPRLSFQFSDTSMKSESTH